MTSESDYYKAYLRQKQARELAEHLLENKSRELYEAGQELQNTYEKLQSQNELLVQQEKMATLGFLSAGVAHEINSPVGFVKSNLQTLIEYIAEVTAELDALENFFLPPYNPETIVSDLQKSRQTINHLKTDMDALIFESLSGISRIENIVKTLRSLSENKKSEVEKLNLHSLIKKLLSALPISERNNTPVTQDIKVTSDFYGNEGQILQMFLNLLQNAQDACSKTNNIKISAYEEDSFIVIQFIDDGCGISQENLIKIYDAFYTSKAVGIGTGLGMTIVRKIINQHNGSIDVKSAPDKGTCFTIRLPKGSPEAK